MDPQDYTMLKKAHYAVRATLSEPTDGYTKLAQEPGAVGGPDILNQIKQTWEGLDPSLKSTITNAGIGALAGGGLGGLAGGDLGSALTGALAGGVAGGAGTTAYNLLSGAQGMPGEQPNQPGILARIAGGSADAVASNPLTTAGALGAGYFGLSGANPSNANAQLLKTLRDAPADQYFNINKPNTAVADRLRALAPGLGPDANTLVDALSKGKVDDASLDGTLLMLKAQMDKQRRDIDTGRVGKEGEKTFKRLAEMMAELKGVQADPNILKTVKAKDAIKSLAGAEDEGVGAYLKRLVNHYRSGAGVKPPTYNQEARAALRAATGRNPYLKTLGLGAGALGAGALGDAYIKGDV